MLWFWSWNTSSTFLCYRSPKQQHIKWQLSKAVVIVLVMQNLNQSPPVKVNTFSYYSFFDISCCKSHLFCALEGGRSNSTFIRASDQHSAITLAPGSFTISLSQYLVDAMSTSAPEAHCDLLVHLMYWMVLIRLKRTVGQPMWMADEEATSAITICPELYNTCCDFLPLFTRSSSENVALLYSQGSASLPLIAQTMLLTYTATMF